MFFILCGEYSAYGHIDKHPDNIIRNGNKRTGGDGRIYFKFF